MDYQEIAVIGVSCRVPTADTFESFRRIFQEKRCVIGTLPKSRLQLIGADDANQYIHYGYLEGFENFDYNFFHLSKQEAIEMDPQHRLALELAEELFENAGYSYEDVHGSKTAVILSAGNSGFQNLRKADSAAGFIGDMSTFCAARISYFYGLTGVSCLLDSTCSSSLNAIHQVCLQLQCGEADMGIAGGLNLMVTPISADIEDYVGVSSPDKVTRSFDEKASGTGGGESCGMVLLKRLSDAVRDGDHIYAVIKGSAVNNDGDRSNNIMAPSSLAQTEVIVEALKRSHLSAREVEYLEAHGTATRIGDPIEVEGITNAYRRDTDEKGYCSLSAAKSNLGHTSYSAGIVSFLKAVCAVYYGEKYPICFLEHTNKLIDFENSPLVPCRKTELWQSEKRTAAISSFGFSGTNVHTLIQNYSVKEKLHTELDLKAYPFVISGKTKESLKHNIQNMIADLETSAECVRDISFTLTKGRTQYEYAVSFLATTLDDAIAKLKNALQEEPVPQKEKRQIVILCSGDAFGTSFAEIQDHFAWTVSMLKKLKQYAIKPISILGNSIGNYVGRVLSGKMTLAQAQAAISSIQDYGTIQKEVAQNAMRQLKEKYHCLFVAVGQNGILKELAESIEADVLSVPMKDEMAFLQCLFEQGVSVDWSSLYVHAHRVVLPTYAFDRSFCWPQITKISKTLDAPKQETEEISTAGKTVEMVLREIWEELLGISDFTEEDDFFTIGGTSLLTMKMINRIKHVYGVTLEFDDVDENDSIQSLADFIRERLPDEPVTIKNMPEQVEHLVHLSPSTDYPVSYEQKSMLYLYETNRNSTAYHMTSYFSLQGEIHIEQIQQAFEWVVKENEILHSIYEKKDGQYVQKPASSSLFQFSVFPMGTFETEQQAFDALKEMSQRPFILEEEVPIRCCCIMMREDYAMLLFQMHHIAGDNWSAEIIVKQAAHYYQELISGKKVMSPIKESYTYSDYTVWQNQLLIGEQGAKKIAFWKDYLKNPPQYLSVPCDKKRGNAHGREGLIKSVLSPAESQNIFAYTEQHKISTYLFLLTVYNIILYRYTMQKDFCVGITAANRTTEEMEQIIGFFANTLVFRSQFEEQETFDHLIQKNKENLNKILSNQEIPFELVVEELHPERNAVDAPFFRQMFTVQFDSEVYDYFSDIEMRELQPEANDAKFEFMLIVGKTKENQISIVLEYDTNLYQKETMELFMNRYVSLISALLEKPFENIDLISMQDEWTTEETDDTEDYDF